MKDAVLEKAPGATGWATGATEYEDGYSYSTQADAGMPDGSSVDVDLDDTPAQIALTNLSTVEGQLGERSCYDHKFASEPAGTSDGGRFATTEHGESGMTLDEIRDESAPNRHDVESARQRMNSFVPSVRPMYRSDWERINGGHGPTLQQSRQETRARSEAHREIVTARAEYHRIRAADEASDKTQDDRMVKCMNCGTTFDELDGECPTCGHGS